MDAIILAIISFVVGAVTYTGISYVSKYLKDPTVQFNNLYLLTALLSMFLVILLAPTFLLPGILPFAVSGFTGFAFIIAAGFCIGFVANFLINMPLTFLLKKLAELQPEGTVGGLTNLDANKKRILIIAAVIGLIALIGTTSVYAVVQYNASIHAKGSIAGIGIKIFSDAGLSNEVTEIDWGLREPGSSKTYTVYIENTKNTPATLSMYTSNWDPAVANDYMTLTWDYDDSVLQPQGVITVTFTLTVDAEVSGITNFDFQITVTATST